MDTAPGTRAYEGQTQNSRQANTSRFAPATVRQEVYVSPNVFRKLESTGPVGMKRRNMLNSAACPGGV